MRRLGAALAGLVLIASVVVFAAAILGAVRGGDDEARSEDGDAAQVCGGSIPASFPEEIPLPDGAKFCRGGQGIGWSFELTAVPGEVIDFYESNLPGVDVVGDEDVQEVVTEIAGVRLVWEGRVITYTVGEPGSLSISDQR